jgi:hypothetical protein
MINKYTENIKYRKAYYIFLYDFGYATVSQNWSKL